MYEVLSNVSITPLLHRMEIRAPRIAAARKPGQFVIIRAAEGEERIPLTIADANADTGTITVFVQAVGASTRVIVAVPVGGSLRDIAGPLGQPAHIENWGRVACVGGGVGTAVLFPLARALADAGNEVTTIIGGRSESLIILKDELGAFSKEVKITTEDGTMGRKGFVTMELSDMMADPATCPGAVFAIGPVPMMRAVAELTRPQAIPTYCSLNPIMIDGTGMCGGCRVLLDGETRFACVDGPEFDAHKVDFANLFDRLGTYKTHEAADCRLKEVLK
jgi:ferredoxin/flavodoxin---NADP+ reductase